jgi:hypothetical protein
MDAASTAINAIVITAVGALLAWFSKGRFDAIDQRFDAIDQRFDSIDHLLDRVDQRIDAVNFRFE